MTTFLKLTLAAAGRPVYVNAAAIGSIEPVGTFCILTMIDGDSTINVMESSDTIERMLIVTRAPVEVTP